MSFGSGRDSHRGKMSVRLVRSLRGDGRLIWDGGETAVAYQLDVFEGRNRMTGSGSIDGPMRPLAATGLRAGVLRLEDGIEVEVALSEVEPDNAMFETRGQWPEGLGA